MKFEEALNALQSVANELESADTTLDKSLELYQKGVELAKLCMDELNEAKGKIAVIKKEMDKITEIDAPEDLK